MTWRDDITTDGRANWLLALPPRARVLPPLLLAVLGGLLLVWLHDHAPAGFNANLSPIIWCAVGAGLLVRGAQSLVVSATAFGMAGLAGSGALGIALALDRQDWQPADAVRIALWGTLTLLALPAAIREALGARPALARRFYFAAILVFFTEQGVRRLLGASGRPSEALFFFLVALVALFAVSVAPRTVAAADEGDTDMPEPLSRSHPVRYLGENPPSTR
jgi:hypothetical protein